MVRYIKANPKVVEYLHLKESRNQLRDTNYILWQSDILEFGSLTQLPEILEQIGAIALSSHEARQEQDGEVLRPLPVATDPRFIIETPEVPENAPENEPENEGEGTEAPEGESPAEAESGAPAEESNPDPENNEEE